MITETVSVESDCESADTSTVSLRAFITRVNISSQMLLAHWDQKSSRKACNCPATAAACAGHRMNGDIIL